MSFRCANCVWPYSERQQQLQVLAEAFDTMNVHFINLLVDIDAASTCVNDMEVSYSTLYPPSLMQYRYFGNGTTLKFNRRHCFVLAAARKYNRLVILLRSSTVSKTNNAQYASAANLTGR